jgi:prepilin-type N-terminal cleavage/methylation domain-containing protein
MRATIARRGFTLVELLVVIAIIVGLMAMVALAAPRFAERQGPSRGAMQLQSWLNLSRQMAIRDQRPRGLRILPPATGGVSIPNDANYARELVYIEQPDDFVPAPLSGTAELWFPGKVGANPAPPGYSGAARPDYSWAVIAVIDPYSTSPPQTIVAPAPNFPDDPNATIRRGDILNIQGSGEGVVPTGPRRIVNVVDGGMGADPSGKPARLYYIQLDQPVGDDPINNKAPNWYRPHTAQYVIYRQPRPMAGEPVLQMPRDVGIDFSRDPSTNDPRKYAWSRFYPYIGTGNGQPLEILFHPNGSVMGPLGTNYARICLWVRDVSQDWNSPAQLMQLPPGDNSLITIYTRTGMVASHPIDPSGLTPGPAWNPFRFTQDSLLSGQ